MKMIAWFETVENLEPELVKRLPAHLQYLRRIYLEVKKGVDYGVKQTKFTELSE